MVVAEINHIAGVTGIGRSYAAAIFYLFLFFGGKGDGWGWLQTNLCCSKFQGHSMLLTRGTHTVLTHTHPPSELDLLHRPD